jgi:hypothetical protein
MNTYQIIIVLLIVSGLGYFFFTQKAIRQLVNYGMAWKRQSEDYKFQLSTLTDQYRQLAKINQALREIKKSKGKK